MKSLTEMNLNELWLLFPVSLTEQKREWNVWYRDEAKNILSLLSENTVKRISHIGSTAIPEILAKNIVDILLEVGSRKNLIQAKHILTQNDWLCMSESADRISLNKGYTPRGYGDRVFHLHVRLFGDNDELYFRDYLRENAETAKQYEALKISLRNEFEFDRDRYTEGKGEFVKKYTEIARKRYPNKY